MKMIKLCLIVVLLSSIAIGDVEDFQRILSSSSNKTRTMIIDQQQYQCKPLVAVKPKAKKRKVVKKKPVPVKETVVVKEVPVINTITVIKTVTVQEDISNKNRVKLYLGVAPGYTGAARFGNKVTLENKLGLVPGIGYERQLSYRWSVEGIWLFNKSYLLGVGYSF